jgi:hypothetical protein
MLLQKPSRSWAVVKTTYTLARLYLCTVENPDSYFFCFKSYILAFQQQTKDYSIMTKLLSVSLFLCSLIFSLSSFSKSKLGDELVGQYRGQIVAHVSSEDEATGEQHEHVVNCGIRDIVIYPTNFDGYETYYLKADTASCVFNHPFFFNMLNTQVDIVDGVETLSSSNTDSDLGQLGEFKISIRRDFTSRKINGFVFELKSYRDQTRYTGEATLH